MNTDLTVTVPVRGSLLVRFDGSDELHEVGRFEQDVPVRFDSSQGVTTVRLNQKP